MIKKPEMILAALGLVLCAALVLYQSLSLSDIELRSAAQTVAAQTAEASSKSRYAVDINHATKKELMGVRYISETIADAILAYRAENGDFLYEEELLNVDGIGEVTLSRIEPYIVLG